MRSREEKEYVRLAMIDGKAVYYSSANHARNPAYNGKDLYPEDKFRYLGEGVVHSVNNVLQNSKTKLHFWIEI